MGNCSSCLGARRRSVYEDDDESRLLFDDADGAHYGSFGEPAMNEQDDAQESQREFEALQNVVARTSDNMVDVFEIAPPRPNPNAVPAPYALGIPDNRFAQYQNLLSKLSATDDGDPEARFDEYLEVEAVPAQPTYSGVLPANAADVGPFVGNFTDDAKPGP